MHKPVLMALLLGLTAREALAYPELAEKNGASGMQAAPTAPASMPPSSMPPSSMPPSSMPPASMPPASMPPSAAAPEAESPALPAMSEAPAGAPPNDEAEITRRTRGITEGLRCPVCQGLSAADSQAESAVAMCVRTEDLVRAGYDDAQIRAWFVGRYGEWVLLEPPRQGRHWLVWLGPLAFLGLGALVVAWRMTAATETAGTLAHTEQGEDPFERRILDELERS